MGFYVNVFVDAKDPEEADFAAVDVIWKDDWFKNPSRNSKDDPPVLYVEEIYELRSFKGRKRPREGLYFIAKLRKPNKEKSTGNHEQPNKSLQPTPPAPLQSLALQSDKIHF